METRSDEAEHQRMIDTYVNQPLIVPGYHIKDVKWHINWGYTIEISDGRAYYTEHCKHELGKVRERLEELTGIRP